MRPARSRLVAAATLAIVGGTAMAVPAGAGDAARAPATATVLVKNDRFVPKRIVIRRGDYVRWRWASGGDRHDVVSRHFRDSELMGRGTHRVRFRRRGRFPYVCTVHQPDMDGVVVVR